MRHRGLSHKEAAEALAILIGTVMSRLHRGRAQLRRELAAADPAFAGSQPNGHTVNAHDERIGGVMTCRDVLRRRRLFL